MVDIFTEVKKKMEILDEIIKLCEIRMRVTSGDNKKFVKISATLMKSLEKKVSDNLASYLKVKK